MSENITVIFWVPCSPVLNRYVLEATSPAGALVSPAVKPQMIAECYTAEYEQILHPSALAFQGCFSPVRAHSWTRCFGTAMRVSFPDTPGSHFRSAIEFILWQQSWVEMWKLDSWPAQDQPGNVFLPPVLWAVHLYATAELHILWHAVGLWSQVQVVETIYANSVIGISSVSSPYKLLLKNILFISF